MRAAVGALVLFGLAMAPAAGCVREGSDPVPEQHVLEVGAAPGGMITSEPPGISCGSVCRASFVRGSVVTLMARPHAGVRLIEWGPPCSGRSICTLSLRQAIHIEARFELVGGAPVPADFRPPQDIDGDGVLDDADQCPVEAAPDGGPTGDGCP